MQALSKQQAGYHILMILSAVDHLFNVQEDEVIRIWLIQHFSAEQDLDDDMATISALAPTEWHTHFGKCMQQFQQHSSEDERHNLVMFAADLISADQRVHHNENAYVAWLFDEWFPEEIN